MRLRRERIPFVFGLVFGTGALLTFDALGRGSGADLGAGWALAVAFVVPAPVAGLLAFAVGRRARAYWTAAVAAGATLVVGLMVLASDAHEEVFPPWAALTGYGVAIAVAIGLCGGVVAGSRRVRG